MTITSAKTGVWILDDTYKKIQSGLWDYSGSVEEPATLWIWGPASNGRLGDNTTIVKSSPVQIPGTQWTKVNGLSYCSSGAIKSDSTAWVWGGNAYGQLGLNNAINRSSPTQIPGTNWNRVVIHSASLGLKNDGTLWAWGINDSGQLAQNNLTHRSSPIQIPGTNWAHIDAVNNRAAAIKTDGTLWVWGNAIGGHLGVGDVNNRSSPTQIPGTQWVDIKVFSGNSGPTIARKSDGTAWSWGQNSVGQLGHNDRIHRCSPFQIPGTNWVNMVSYYSMSMGRKTDGTLWSWGYPVGGQTGLNLPGTQPAANCFTVSSPTQIPGTNWANVNVAPSGAVKTDGTLWMWGGQTFSPRLGDGTLIPRSSPIQIPGNTWKEYHGQSRARR
jgi:alpha-tubulin suppressor-like RCC1 family protein